jgi:hypothetical protein
VLSGRSRLRLLTVPVCPFTTFWEKKRPRLLGLWKARLAAVQRLARRQRNRLESKLRLRRPKSKLRLRRLKLKLRLRRLKLKLRQSQWRFKRRAKRINELILMR